MSMDINLIEKVRYHPETKKCYSVGYQGPCGKNMAFYAKDNLHGACDCKEDQRILIYHRDTNQCYYIFQQVHIRIKYINTDQSTKILRSNPIGSTTKLSLSFLLLKGYCKKGKWLDMARFGKPTCRTNECFKYQSRNSTIDLVKFKGNCVEVGKSATGCPEGEVVGFAFQKRSPTCVPSRLAPAAPGMRSIGIPTTPCSPGSVMAISGTCQPPFDFD